MVHKCFEIKDDFYLDGKRIKLISGGLHYFRVVESYWRDRLEKLKALGCNAVETYIPWNLHEENEGEFHFEGNLNIKEFIRIAGELDLMVIVRPAPYICAEWEFGGLPAWLLNKPDMRVRTNTKEFLHCVAAYYKELFQILTPLQINYGGPIIMMQVENEYGYYGDDIHYMEAIKNLMMQNGAVVPFVTSDGPMEAALKDGGLPGVLATANFGSRTIERFEVLKKHIGDKPLMCMEYWAGWFDAWGCGGHNRSPLEENIKDLDDMLRLGHVNFYMFHGGTNFGFMNGSNYYDKLEPDVTSYDYDAVLTEDGQFTDKYYEFQKIIAKYAKIPKVTFSTKIERKSYGTLEVTGKVDLFASLCNISEPTESPYTKTMEQLGQNYGYILYKSVVKKGKYIEKFKLSGAADRAIIFEDKKHLAIRYDHELSQECELHFEKEEVNLNILVENMGRVNYGVNLMKQRKGIQDGVLINNVFHSNWTHYCLPLDNLESLDFAGTYTEGAPAFYKFEFQTEEPGDTFLELEHWGKGCAFVNGKNIGRFWEIGPQKRLYIPGPYLKKGLNQIIIFETDGKAGKNILLTDEPDLG